jgi:hypothetical protein
MYSNTEVDWLPDCGRARAEEARRHAATTAVIMEEEPNMMMNIKITD